MDRVLLGKAPGNTSSDYNRSFHTGLYISKPGANVLSCSDGELIFDSTGQGLMQVIAKGNVKGSKGNII